MEPDVFGLLLGFTLTKMAIGLGILWLGFRSGEQPSGEDEGGEGGDDPRRPPSPSPPSRRSRRPARAPGRRAVRGGPGRRGARRVLA